MACLEWITAGKDVLVGIAAAVTAGVAYAGLQSWKRELKGKTEFETARGLVKATYKLRDEMQNCRSPFLSNAEFPVDWNYGPGPHSPAADARAFDYAYKNRFTHVLNAVQEFDAHTLEAESLWVSNVRSKTDELGQCVREFYAAISAVVFDKANSGQDFESDKEFGRRMRGVISTAEPENTNVFRSGSTRLFTASKARFGRICRRRALAGDAPDRQAVG